MKGKNEKAITVRKEPEALAREVERIKKVLPLPRQRVSSPEPVSAILPHIFQAGEQSMTDKEVEARNREIADNYLPNLAKERRRERWERVVPGTYREEFDMRKVDPSVNLEEVQKILRWQPNPRGLYVQGESGHSKTRAVFAMLGREYLVHGHHFTYIGGIDFALEAAAKFGDCSQAQAWINALCLPEILFIDDAFKRWTPATEEAFFAVVEKRTAWKKPIIVTNNYTKAELTEQSKDQQVVLPTLRRLREFCEVVML